MTRQQAESLIAPHIRYFTLNRIPGVHVDDVRRLLGDTTFEKLKRDVIRRLGHDAESVYPWNVADYLQLNDYS